MCYKFFYDARVIKYSENSSPINFDPKYPTSPTLYICKDVAENLI